MNFYKPEYDVSGWKDIKVPSSFQVEGYGTPDYSNFTYIFQKDFPRVMSTPPVEYTTYQERNPVGSYRRNFEVPEDWNGRRIFITFDGVDAGFFIWVNGQKVGYSVNSRNAAEFDLTKYLKPGKNILAVEVYRFTSGSYLENQDMWRLSGIFRNVTLWSAPQEPIRDYFIKTELDKQFRDADVVVTTKVKNYGTTAVKACELNVSLYKGTTSVFGYLKTAHPPQKQQVGDRLARFALTNDYGKKMITSGPLFKKATASGNKLIIEFESVGTGLAASDKGLFGFEIAGTDKKFAAAPAKLAGNKEVLSTPSIAAPVYARYAWSDSSSASLFNKEGLPASTFTSDK